MDSQPRSMLPDLPNDLTVLGDLEPPTSDYTLVAWEPFEPVSYAAEWFSYERHRNTQELIDYNTVRRSSSFRTLLESCQQSGSYGLEISADWALAEFCRTELGDSDEPQATIPLLLTLTKTLTERGAAQAASCEEYTNLVYLWRSRQVPRSCTSAWVGDGTPRPRDEASLSPRTYG
jgi:hypothetical protein